MRVLLAVVLAIALTRAEEVEVLNESDGMLAMPEVTHYHCMGRKDAAGQEHLQYEYDLKAAMANGEISKETGKKMMDTFQARCHELDKTELAAANARHEARVAVRAELSKQESKARELGEDATAQAEDMPTVDAVTCSDLGANEYQARLEKAKVDKAEGMKKIQAFGEACKKFLAQALAKKVKARVERQLGDGVELSATVPDVSPENCGSERLEHLKTVMEAATIDKPMKVQDLAKKQYANFVAQCQGFSAAVHEELGEDATAMTQQQLLAAAEGKDLPSVDKDHCSPAMMSHWQMELKSMVQQNTIFKKEGHLRMSLFSKLCDHMYKQFDKDNAAEDRENKLEKEGLALLKKERTLGDSEDASDAAMSIPAIDAAHCTEEVSLGFQRQMEDANVDVEAGKKAMAKFADGCKKFLHSQEERKLGDSAETQAKMTSDFTPVGGSSAANCDKAGRKAYVAALEEARGEGKLTEEEGKAKFANFVAECEGFSDAPLSEEEQADDEDEEDLE